MRGALFSRSSEMSFMSIFPSAARPRRLAGRAVLCGLAGFQLTERLEKLLRTKSVILDFQWSTDRRTSVRNKGYRTHPPLDGCKVFCESVCSLLGAHLLTRSFVQSPLLFTAAFA